MSGNFNKNRRQGNGNRRGNRSSGSARSANKKSTQLQVKFAPYSNNNRGSYATFETVKEAAVSKISEGVTYHSNDIILAIETEKEIDFDDPSIKPTRKKDSDANVQKENDMIYDHQVKAWISRQETYSNNKRKAYDIIIGFCTSNMKERIKEHPDYAKFNGNPVSLLKIIKIVIHDPVADRYPFASLLDSLQRALTIRQGEKESLTEYTKRFKQGKDVLESNLGTDWLNDFVVKTEEYKKATSSGQQEGRWGIRGALAPVPRRLSPVSESTRSFSCPQPVRP